MEFVKKPTGTWKAHHRVAYPGSAQLQSLKLMEEIVFGIQPFANQAKDQITIKWQSIKCALIRSGLGGKRHLLVELDHRGCASVGENVHNYAQHYLGQKWPDQALTCGFEQANANFVV